MKLIIINARIILYDSVLENGWLLVEDGLIRDYGVGKPVTDIADKILDAEGNYLSPGFIDIHVHGGDSADFRDGSEKAYLRALRAHFVGGTTTIFPTLSACPWSVVRHSIDVFASLKNKESKFDDIPELGGIHLEGPYLSEYQLGAQNVNYICLPDSKEYKPLIEENDCIKRWSIACELPGALELGDYLKEHGVSASVGHSNATCAEAMEAFKHGFSSVTHIYSSCSVVHRNGPYREAGLVEAAFLSNETYVEVIGDGIHLPPDFLRLIYKIKGPDRIALITDCIRPGAINNVPNGTVAYDDLEMKQPIYIESGVAVMPDHKSFAGSIATTSRVVRTIHFKAGIPIVEAVRMSTYNPAKIIGIENTVGSITVGLKANLLIFDDDINIQKIILKGRITDVSKLS